MRLYARAVLIASAIFILGLIYQQRFSIQPHHSKGAQPPGCHVGARHAIDDLINRASDIWSSLLVTETRDVKSGAAAYRARRGRHPPPGFDIWYDYARSSGAIIVEDFFDQIYRDLEPFWGVEPKDLRASVADFEHILTIRNGRIQDVPNTFFRTEIWVDMISKIVQHLPDMDIALNRLDEARSIAPRKVVDAALAKAESQKVAMMRLQHTDFTSDMPMSSTGKIATTWRFSKTELHTAIRDSCPADSPLAKQALPWPATSQKTASAYVEDTVAAKDICKFPEMTSQHGDLVEPATVDFTTSLIPIFTGSKLPLYNDIVIPEPSYYSDDRKFTGKTLLGDWSTWYSWNHKTHGLVWRGGSTGGAVRDDNWHFFHRNRLVSYLNASETNSDIIGNRPGGHFSEWLASTTNAAFTKLFCDYAHDAKQCPSLASHYGLAKPISMAGQYQWKYLPDTDGNSVSERFRAFLLSNSAPIKATIFDDWQDHRILAWRHYIPMHISYDELYGIMTYFLGYDKECAHDDAGRRIAEEGRQWSEKVLRKDDMVIYLHRVLLEYARVVHDNRDRLGYVSDLS